MNHHQKGIRGSVPVPIEERFWLKVRKTKRCWEWIGCCQSKGYGTIQFKGTLWLAHRISWTLHYGEIQKNINVLHRCDNPSCVNPNHLFLGTYLDNARDRENKGRGRQPNGIKHGRAKLTEEQVRTIRKNHASGMYLKTIAARFGIHFSTVGRIVRGEIWGSLP